MLLKNALKSPKSSPIVLSSKQSCKCTEPQNYRCQAIIMQSHMAGMLCGICFTMPSGIGFHELRIGRCRIFHFHSPFKRGCPIPTAWGLLFCSTFSSHRNGWLPMFDADGIPLLVRIFNPRNIRHIRDLEKSGAAKIFRGLPEV